MRLEESRGLYASLSQGIRKESGVSKGRVIQRTIERADAW